MTDKLAYDNGNFPEEYFTKIIYLNIKKFNIMNTINNHFWKKNLFGLIVLILLSVSLSNAQTVDDPFQWLEDVEGENQLAWVTEHNKTTLQYITNIDGYQERYDYIYEILTSSDLLVYPVRQGDYIYNFWQDENNPRGIIRRIPVSKLLSKEKNWELILDLDSLSVCDSINWVFKGIQFAPDESSRCIFNLSAGGSDAVYLKEFDLQSFQFVTDGFNVGEAKSDIQWIDEDHVYISSNFGEGTLTTSGYARIVKRWERGTKLEDAEIVYEASVDDMAVAPIVLHDSASTHEFVLHYTNFFNKNLYYIDDTCLIKLPLPEDFYFDLLDDNFIVCPFSNWNTVDGIIEKGSVVNIKFNDLKRGILTHDVLFKGNNRTSVEGIFATSNSIILNTLDNIKSVVLKYTIHDGIWKQEKVNYPPSGSIEIVDINRLHPEYFVTYESFIQPTTLYIDNNDGKAPVPVMSLPSYFDASSCQVNQYEAQSKDGTMIPYFVISKNDLQYNGQNPTILYGYGGFQVSEKPYYSISLGKLWIEEGGVYVIANIRGGGEFGPDWHNAAILENKQNSYDDFIAVAEAIQAQKITSSQKLGITGGSNGGLLVGAVMVQRPELFNAVVCIVPLLDMKRYSILLAGQSWVAEYGDPDIPEQWDYISKYSPYQNLNADKKYPEVLFLTSTRDDRVHPGHARKMTAKMEALGAKVYLFENTEGGHAASYTPEQHAKLVALNYSFFIDKLKN